MCARVGGEGACVCEVVRVRPQKCLDVGAPVHAQSCVCVRMLVWCVCARLRAQKCIFVSACVCEGPIIMCARALYMSVCKGALSCATVHTSMFHRR